MEWKVAWCSGVDALDAPVTLGLGEDDDAVRNVAAETMDATSCSIPS